MSNTAIFFICIALGLITFITRTGFMLFEKPLALSKKIEETLKFAPILILSSSIILELFYDKELFTGWINTKSLTLIVLLIIYLITKNSILALLAGLLVWLLFQFLQIDIHLF